MPPSMLPCIAASMVPSMTRNSLQWISTQTSPPAALLPQDFAHSCPSPTVSAEVTNRKALNRNVSGVLALARPCFGRRKVVVTAGQLRLSSNSVSGSNHLVKFSLMSAQAEAVAGLVMVRCLLFPGFGTLSAWRSSRLRVYIDLFPIFEIAINLVNTLAMRYYVDNLLNKLLLEEVLRYSKFVNEILQVRLVMGWIGHCNLIRTALRIKPFRRTE